MMLARLLDQGLNYGCPIPADQVLDLVNDPAAGSLFTEEISGDRYGDEGQWR